MLSVFLIASKSFGMEAEAFLSDLHKGFNEMAEQRAKTLKKQSSLMLSGVYVGEFNGNWIYLKDVRDLVERLRKHHKMKDVYVRNQIKIEPNLINRVAYRCYLGMSPFDGEKDDSKSEK